MQTPPTHDCWANTLAYVPDFRQQMNPDMGCLGTEACCTPVFDHSAFSYAVGVGNAGINQPQAWSTPLQINHGLLVGNSIALPSNSVGSWNNVGSDLLSDTVNESYHFDVYEAPVNVAVSNNNSILSSGSNHGCQVTTSNQDNNVSGSKTRHICQWYACRSSFSRMSDLQRHIDTVHLKFGLHHCQVDGCSKRFGQWKGYSRLDKLQEHMRKKHFEMDALYPIEGRGLRHAQDLSNV